MKSDQFKPNTLLIQARLQLVLSQSALALQLGVSLKALWKWENGRARPYPRHRFRLCLFFQKTAQELGLDPVSIVFTEAEPLDSPETIPLQTFLEKQKDNPAYFREYQAYVQRSQQLHPLHSSPISFVEWFLAAHPEHTASGTSQRENNLNEPA